MALNAEAEKMNNENNVSLIRRFTKRIRGSGVLMRVKRLRYRTRPTSKYGQKKRALKGIERKKEITRLIKLGKYTPKRGPNARRSS